MTLRNNLSRYMDAGFPILYINTFDENKAEHTIREVADRRTICTWSIANGYGEYSTKTHEWLLLSPSRKNGHKNAEKNRMNL